MKTEAIKVQKGERIQTAWERLVRWVDTLKVVPNDGILVRETPKGTIITVRQQNQPHNHPFKVGISGLTVTISPGTVNSMFPFVLDKSKKQWRPIMTLGLQPPYEKPIMEVDVSKFEGGKFYISLRVKTNIDGSIIRADQDLQIVATKTDLGDDDGAFYYPIAACYLNASRSYVEEYFQIVHHNLRYLYQDNNAGSRLLFFST
jgi:hypothetical protein